MCEQFREDYKEALEMVLGVTLMIPEKRHLIAMHQALLKCREEKEELREKIDTMNMAWYREGTVGREGGK